MRDRAADAASAAALAVVAETDVCDDETSNSQKVRVQKKKAARDKIMAGKTIEKGLLIVLRDDAANREERSER